MLLRRHSEGLKGSRSFAQDVFAGLRARPADTLGRSRSLLDVPHSSNVLHPWSLVRTRTDGGDVAGGGVLSRPVLPWRDGQCQPLAPSEGEPRSRVFLRPLRLLSAGSELRLQREAWPVGAVTRAACFPRPRFGPR